MFIVACPVVSLCCRVLFVRVVLIVRVVVCVVYYEVVYNYIYKDVVDVGVDVHCSSLDAEHV